MRARDRGSRAKLEAKEVRDVEAEAEVVEAQDEEEDVARATTVVLPRDRHMTSRAALT